MAEKKHYLISGRIPFDDEDTAYTFHCGRDELVRLFEKRIYNDSQRDDQDAVVREHGAVVFVNVIACSDSPITTE